MAVLNNLDRYQLALDVLKRVRRIKSAGDPAAQFFHDKLREHREYVGRHGEDMPEVRNWKWEG
jgi:xylulose-5-phosphate/fructose-6-phosphate phosphoketolase